MQRKGNLNFNYKIALLPERLADYIIVHELCHLKEVNHSQKFWNLVAKMMPDYLEIRNELKKSGIKSV
ncbi:MAG: M48 family metallopeptidase [Candidatus Paceibacterota bacterium]